MISYENGKFWVYLPKFESEAELQQVFEHALKVNGFHIISTNRGDSEHRPDIIAREGDERFVFELKNTKHHSTNNKIGDALNQLTTYLRKYSADYGVVVSDAKPNGLVLKYSRLWHPPNTYKNGKQKIFFAFADVSVRNGTPMLRFIMAKSRTWLTRFEILTVPAFLVSKLKYSRKEVSLDALLDLLYWDFYAQSTAEWYHFTRLEGIPTGVVEALKEVALSRGYVLHEHPSGFTMMDVPWGCDERW